MLDRKYIVENAELVKQNCQNRGVTADIDNLVSTESRRREVLREVEDLNRRANEIAKSIKSQKDPDAKKQRIEEGRDARSRKDAAQAEHDRLDQEVKQLQSLIPNMSHPCPPSIHSMYSCGQGNKN